MVENQQYVQMNLFTALPEISLAWTDLFHALSGVLHLNCTIQFCPGCSNSEQ